MKINSVKTIGTGKQGHSVPHQGPVNSPAKQHIEPVKQQTLLVHTANDLNKGKK